jgi:hypothetical protein
VCEARVTARGVSKYFIISCGKQKNPLKGGSYRRRKSPIIFSGQLKTVKIYLAKKTVDFL